MNDISKGCTVSQESSTTNSLNGKTVDAQFVLDWLLSSELGWPSITITRRAKYADSSVPTVTIALSDGIETVTVSEEWPIILIEELVGTFLRK